MRDYRLRCWDEDEIAVEESAITFSDEDEAVFAALELARDYQNVELWAGEALIAYLARTDETAALMAKPRVVH